MEAARKPGHLRPTPWSYDGDYTETLSAIQRALRPRTYVEIGFYRAKTLSLVEPETLAIGIDPAPEVARPLTRKTRIFAETSDAFFERDVATVLQHRPIDLAFIDGMHLFEYAFRDFRNLERYCGQGSMILVHDCLPPNAESAARDRTEGFWTGDVWKLLLCLHERRPDLTLSVVAAAPSGLGVITNLDPSSRVLWDDEAACLGTYMERGYEDLAARVGTALKIVPNDWKTIEPLLPAEPFQPSNPDADTRRIWPRDLKTQVRRARAWFSGTRAATPVRRLLRR